MMTDSFLSVSVRHVWIYMFDRLAIEKTVFGEYSESLIGF